MISALRTTLQRLGLHYLAETPVRQREDIPDFSDDEDEVDEPTTGGGAAVRELRMDPDAIADEPTGVHACFELASGARSDRGTRRRRNEDALLILEEEGLYVVADGMGGHAGGEVASQLAIDAFASTFVEGSEVPCVLSNVPPRGAQLVQGFAAANEAVRSVAARDPKLSEMGTTLVAARFCPKKRRAYIGSVGDSRCYRLRDGHFGQLTSDHTLAALGVTGRDAGRLSRAVGTSGIVEADLMVVEPRGGDIYLLCSDGLTKTLTDATVRDVLARERDPEIAAAELISRANGAGARDNVTVIIVHVASRGDD